MKEGKIWNITYEMENIVFTDPKAMEGFKMLGVDFASEKFAHRVHNMMIQTESWYMIRFKLNCVQVKENAAKYGEEMARLVG